MFGGWPELAPPTPLRCSGDRCELQWQDKAWTWSWLTPGPCRVPSTEHLQGRGGNAVRQNQGQPGEPQLLTRSPEIKQTELYKSLIMVERCLIAAINIERNKCMKQKYNGTGHCRANWGICVNHPEGLPAEDKWCFRLSLPTGAISDLGGPQKTELCSPEDTCHCPARCLSPFWASASCRSNSRLKFSQEQHPHKRGVTTCTGVLKNCKKLLTAILYLTGKVVK